MTQSMIEQPEILLTLESGIKQALKKMTKDAGLGDLRDEASPDTTFEGLTLDFQLEVESVTFGHDTDKSPTCSIPMLAAMALLVKRMGVTRDGAMEVLLETMREAMALGKNASKELLAETGVADAQKAIKDEVISKLPRTKVRKSVKVKGAKLHVKSVGVSD
jgi:hypothetical protein